MTRLITRLAVVAVAASVVALVTGGATGAPTRAEANISPLAEADLTLTLNCAGEVRADVTWDRINPKAVVLVIIKGFTVDQQVWEFRGNNRSGSRSLVAGAVGTPGEYTAIGIVTMRITPDPLFDPLAPIDERFTIVLFEQTTLSC